MLKFNQIEKLEIMQKWLEEIVESEEFKDLDFYPDVTLGDSLQGIEEVLTNYYPSGYTPPRFEDEKPVMHLRWVKGWREKLVDGLSSITITSLLTAAVTASTSIFFWGVSDIDRATGNRLSPDFAQQSHLYRGAAIASLGLFLLSGVAAACTEAGGKGDA